MGEREVVLILQIGSLGDTVIAVPCFREIARRHPDADCYLVTNFPIGNKMVSAEAILRPTGLIAGCIEYPMPLRKLGPAIDLRRRIMKLKPTTLYYLLPETRSANLARHYVFFKLCGIKQIRGMPWAHDLRFPRKTASGKLWESEASRLLRTIGATAPPANADRVLDLTAEEQARADAMLGALADASAVIAIAVGGKVPINDWGDDNWGKMLETLSLRAPSLGAMFVGSADERLRNDALAARWHGPSLNTCGLLSPRETAALIARAGAFVGHDTGTLHLAAAVDTPVVGVFSARNRAGKWFSDRSRDTFFYDHVACAGCELVEIPSCPHNRRCMAAHDPFAVIAAVERALALSRGTEAITT